MKNPIELSTISRYRGELMGAAMLFIILFHVYLPRTDMFFGLRRMGNVGVDIFFFLSGLGLWYSWTKLVSNLPSPSGGAGGRLLLPSFYKRRYLRVYPAWLVMACLFYIPDFINHGGHSVSLVDLFGDILINWDFWLHDELTFWYIPATMMLYMVAPFYMMLILRQPVYRWLPVAMIMWCVMVQWVLPIHDAVGHIEIFWSRVPIFFIGINMGEAVKRKDTLPAAAFWLLLLFFLLSFGSSVYLEQVRHGRFPLFVERMLYIPLTITGILLLNMLLAHLPGWVNYCLRFVGTISLEIYLIHVHFVLHYIEPYRLGYWPTALLCIAITLPLAWLLHQLLDRTINKFIRNQRKPEVRRQPIV